MRVLIDVGHPGHVHFFKNTIWGLEKRGHDVLVSARAKDVTVPLLNHYGLRHLVLSSAPASQIGLLREFVKREIALLRLIRDFRPAVVTEIGGAFIAPVCKIARKTSVVFTDSEPVPLDRVLTYPFATVICTPDCFLRDLGPRHIRYKGYHELAYLHPSYYRPDADILNDINNSGHEPYSVLRFVAWRANHDIGQRGFTEAFKRNLVGTLGHYGRIFITSESPLPEELEPFRLVLPAHRVHDLLYYASLFMGDGATMATEAGLLGTPSVRSSTLALNMGNFVELMEEYQLVFSYYDCNEALGKAVDLIRRVDAKADWQERRQRVFAEKIDVTAFTSEIILSAAGLETASSTYQR